MHDDMIPALCFATALTTLSTFWGEPGGCGGATCRREVLEKTTARRFSPRYQGFHNWRLRERAAGEPLIWRDTPWVVGNKRYSNHANIFVEDGLWRELDANFPNQLNAQQVGE
jgi:hypothetical protein